MSGHKTDQEQILVCLNWLAEHVALRLALALGVSLPSRGLTLTPTLSTLPCARAEITLTGEAGGIGAQSNHHKGSKNNMILNSSR